MVGAVISVWQLIGANFSLQQDKRLRLQLVGKTTLKEQCVLYQVFSAN